MLQSCAATRKCAQPGVLMPLSHHVVSKTIAIAVTGRAGATFSDDGTISLVMVRPLNYSTCN